MSILLNTLNAWDVVPRKKEVLNCSEDLLALSATWHRLRNTPGHLCNFESLTNQRLATLVTDQDREFAHKIKDHYSKKLMMAALLEKKLSLFRTELKNFLLSDGRTYNEPLLPMIYRLPEFYIQDMEFEEIHLQFNKLTDKQTAQHGVELKLTHVKKIAKTVNHDQKIEYWFKDDKGYANLIHLTKHPLLPLWDKLLESGDVALKCNRYVKERDNFKFFAMENWTLVI